MRARSQALNLFEKLILPMAFSELRLGIFLYVIPLAEWVSKSTIISLVRWVKAFPCQEGITFFMMGLCGLWPLSHYQSQITANVHLFNLCRIGALAAGSYFLIGWVGWSLEQLILRGGKTIKIVTFVLIFDAVILSFGLGKDSSGFSSVFIHSSSLNLHNADEPSAPFSVLSD